MIYEIEKPWGREEILEQNENYMVKRLTMNAGQRCSLQYHEKKRETFYVVSGVLTLTIETADGDMQKIQYPPGTFYTIKPLIRHRMSAESGGDVVYLESSTPHPDDVKRVDDDYGRFNSHKR